MKEHLHLFTEIGKGKEYKNCYVFFEIKNMGNYIGKGCFLDGVWKIDNYSTVNGITVLKVLDLSKLTTIDRAEQFAKHSYNAGREGLSNVQLSST